MHAKEDANNYAKWTTAGQCSSLGTVWFTSTALARHCQQICISTASSGEKKKRMTFLRVLVSGEKKTSSSSCSKSGRVEINRVRKMPLKHPSQTAADHSGIYISLVYFLPPQKQSTTSSLFHHSTAACTGYLQRTAVEEEGAFLMCSGDGAQCWDMHGRTPSLLARSWDRTSRPERTGRAERHHLHTFTCTNYYCTALQLLSRQKEATAQGSG